MADKQTYKPVIPEIKPLFSFNEPGDNGEPKAPEGDKTPKGPQETGDLGKWTYKSTVVNDTPIDAQKSKNEAQQLYNKSEQDSDVNYNRNRQRQYYNEVTDPNEWYDMYHYWNWDLAKNGPKGNLNNKSFNDTLRASREADALNNSRHWQSMRTGRRTNSSFGTNEVQKGTSTRWEPIETQETRQMRNNEKLDYLARSRDINRAANVEDYPLEMRKMLDKNTMDLAQQIGVSEVDLNRFIQKSKVQNEYELSQRNFWQQKMAQFVQEMKFDNAKRIYDIVKDLGPLYGNLAGQVLGGVVSPTYAQQIMYQWQAYALSKCTTYEEMQKTLLTMQAMQATLYGNIGINMFKGGFGSLIGSDARYKNILH